jgi:hypothetical protein
VSEAFAFITDQLELPRLTLKMDIYHTGKEDATDDHKLVNERLLQVGISSEAPDGKTITLEDCLESYFNNRVEVRRHLEGKALTNSLRSFDSFKGHAVHIETAEAGSSASSPGSLGRSPLAAVTNPFSLANSRVRSSSIIRERFVEDDPGAAGGTNSGATEGGRQATVRKTSMRKEVLMPAWQFFSLVRPFPLLNPSSQFQNLRCSCLPLFKGEQM